MSRPRRRRVPALLVALAALASLPSLLPVEGVQAAPPKPVRAGVGVVDATWHVGSAAGQYASDPVADEQELPSGVQPGSDLDPHRHAVRRTPSYGVQSRLSVRALVVEGSNGTRIALVKNDLYIPQDMLWRRTAQILEAGDTGIDREHLTMMASHNHSSPFHSSTTWGPWAFQDSFDLRFFEYYARAQAEAVEQAVARLRPVRVGASVSYFDKTHRHAIGPAIADDGTPAGFPRGETDHDMIVVRFDDVSNPARPRPLAILANFGLHPEFLEGNDLISADYLGPLERMVERETGAVLIWSQGAVGTSEPERSAHHSVHERLEFTHRDYGQAEFGARLMADAVIDTWRDVDRGTPEQRGRFVPFQRSVPVEMVDRWYPGHTSHPYPGVSSCRMDQIGHGNPRLPVVGLPDCTSPFEFFDIEPPLDPGITTEELRAAGVPVPENYSAPSYGSLQESLGLHLQAARIGEILLTMSPGELWSEQSKNEKTRTNLIVGDIWRGFDWGRFCRRQADGTYTCPNPHDHENRAADLTGITEQEYRRMRAQVNNDATGWDAPENVLAAESEPADPAEIWGNFSHVELPRSGPGRGYPLTVAIGMANDYNGYLVSYREYQRGDHYRKGLAGWGAHTSDYIATRLVQMGGFLHGGPEPPGEVLDPKEDADQALQDAKGVAIGAAAETLIPAYEAILPDDGGEPGAAVEQPKDITRFAAAFFSWTGGSNYTDLPDVIVQRRVGRRWRDFADMSGEVVVTVRFPEAPGGAAAYLTGAHEWTWTAHFEAFASGVGALGGRPEATPAGTYRFVAEGLARKGGEPAPYRAVSRAFRVRPWDGITVEDLRVERDGSFTFRVGPSRTIPVPTVKEAGEGAEPSLRAVIGPIDYPDSYASPIRFIRHQRTFVRDPDAPDDPRRLEWYCFTCSFRPWADAGRAVTARVTVQRRDGTTVVFRGVPAPGGRWRITAALRSGDRVFVEAGDVRDRFGNVNGRRSAVARV